VIKPKSYNYTILEQLSYAYFCNLCIFTDEILRRATQRYMPLWHTSTKLGLNGSQNGDCPSDASRNDASEGVLQLGEVETGLRFTVPAVQHQLISAGKVNKEQ